MNIAYLGPEGTFTEAAYLGFVERGTFAHSTFADSTFADSDTIRGLPVQSPREAIDAVRSGQADYACVAIENSVDGPVTPTFDALAANQGVQIYDELDIEVAFAIMTRPGESLAQATRLSTHPVAYQQIKNWVAEHLPHVQFTPAPSNAAAAKMVADGEADIAAAPARAATVYGLEVHAEGIADVAGARTRFVAVGRTAKPTPRSGSDRTSVMFTLKNVPGALVGALTEFALREVDLTRIESRPLGPGIGTYRFHVDFAGHVDDQNVAEALRALYLHCDTLTFLGSWPVRDAEPVLQDTSRLDAAAQWVRTAQTGVQGGGC